MWGKKGVEAAAWRISRARSPFILIGSALNSLFIAYSGIATAATIRVGNMVGAGNARSARQSGKLLYCSAGCESLTLQSLPVKSLASTITLPQGILEVASMTSATLILMAADLQYAVIQDESMVPRRTRLVLLAGKAFTLSMKR